MKKRILKDGSIVTELEVPVTLEVYTKCPEKWLLIDLETDEHYIGYNTSGKNNWKKLEKQNARY
jgi:hypothetical protein